MKRKLLPHDISNEELRDFYQKAKEKLRWKVSMLMVVYLAIGLELIAVKYSFTKTISTFLMEHSETLWNLVNYAAKTRILTFMSPIEPAMLGKPLKIAILLLLFFLIFYFICSRDPLSNIRLISDLADGKRHRWMKWLLLWRNELDFYARTCPSSRLPGICKACEPARREKCTSALPALGLDKVWARIAVFGTLKGDTVRPIMEAVHKCRIAFFLKYGSFVSVLLLGFALGFTLVIEKVLGFGGPKLAAIAWILFGLSLFIFFSLTNPVFRSRGYGAWAKFENATNQLLSSTEFRKAFVNTICNARESRQA